MEDRVDALHRRPGHSGFTQIGLQKINFAGPEVMANVAEMAAAEVIDNANVSCASRKELIG
jgi:hypothetical protein